MPVIRLLAQPYLSEPLQQPSCDYFRLINMKIMASTIYRFELGLADKLRQAPSKFRRCGRIVSTIQQQCRHGDVMGVLAYVLFYYLQERIPHHAALDIVAAARPTVKLTPQTVPDALRHECGRDFASLGSDAGDASLQTRRFRQPVAGK